MKFLEYDIEGTIAGGGRSDRKYLRFRLFTIYWKYGMASEIVVIPPERFRVKLEETISPLVQIAENLGFCGGWEYEER